MSLKNKKTHENFKEKFINKFGQDYIFLDEYDGYNKEIKICHTVCNNVFDFLPKRLGVSIGCPYCNSEKKPKITTETFSKYLSQLTDGEYALVGEYTGTHNDVIIKHGECGNSFNKRPSIIKAYGVRCPYCKRGMSILASHFEAILIHNNINFEKELRFDDCRNIYPLPFDYAIYENGKLKCLVEVDGKQHIDNRFFSESFEQLQINDRIKSLYCMSNNIELIRIPHTEQSNIFNYIINILGDSLGVLYTPSKDVIYENDLLRTTKLTSDKILEIQQVYDFEKPTISELSRRYGVTRRTIRNYLKIGK
jgi:hypothetical protein